LLNSTFRGWRVFLNSPTIFSIYYAHSREPLSSSTFD
jgi:hypothetical protein